MESGFAPNGHPYPVRVISGSQYFLPHPDMLFRQYQYDLEVGEGIQESCEGIPQNGMFAYPEELLRNGGTHPETRSACNYDRIFFHTLQKLKYVICNYGQI